MFVRICLLLISLIALPAFSQVAPSAAGGDSEVPAEDEMVTPPPVSGILYPSVAGLDARSNYVTLSVSANGGYIDNVLTSIGPPVSAYEYLITPEIAYDWTTSRQRGSINYKPVITFYQQAGASVPNSVNPNILDSVDHSANLQYQVRVSPRTAIVVQDAFSRSSNVFDGSYPFISGGLAGNAQAPFQAVIAPFAEQLRDVGNGAFTHQFSATAMVGAGGSIAIYNYPNPALSQGLFNSNGGGGSAFWARRFARDQYFGISYDYQIAVGDLTTNSSQINAQTQAILPFYTIYFNRTFSLSLTAGVQNISVAQTKQPTFSSWIPSAVVSLGWQGNRGNIEASFLHTATTGGGLLGAYVSNNVNALGGWKITKTWTAEIAAAYDRIDGANQVIGLPLESGDSLTASATLKHTIGTSFNFEVGYDRLQENYIGIGAVSTSPNSDRYYGALTYEFRKPIGR